MDSDVYVSLQGQLSQFRMEEIIYVEHSSRAVFIHTICGVTYIPYTSLDRVKQALGDDYLCQCHKSFLVNRLFIERIDRGKNQIVLKNYMGKLSMGRKYREGFLKKLHYN
nr:LytTR family transcriptional regulator [Eubacterium sp.]